MNPSNLPLFSNGVNILSGKLCAAQHDMQELQRNAFAATNNRLAITWLAIEIAGLQQRLLRAERLQDAVLSMPD